MSKLAVEVRNGFPYIYEFDDEDFLHAGLGYWFYSLTVDGVDEKKNVLSVTAPANWIMV